MLATHGLNQGVKNTLRDLNHFCRGLIGLLKLQQFGRFFVQIHTRDSGAVLFQIGCN